MAVRIQIRRDTSANWTSNNPVLYPGEIGFETDTKKFKIGPAVSAPTVATAWNSITAYANVVPSDLSNTLNDYILAADLGNPDGPAKLDVDGNLLIPEDSIIFEGATANNFETTLTVTDPTADRTITLPDITGTVVTTGDTGSVTNTMLAGSIANEKLTNSAITINGTSTSLGGTRTLYTDDITEDGSPTNLWFTDERAQDAVAAALAAGTHTNITVTYTDETNAISLVGATTYSDENAQDAIGNALGTGLSYNDTTGAISVDTTTIQARVADVSDTEIGYLNGVTSAIQTQIDAKLASATAASTYAPINNPTFTGTVTLPGNPSTANEAATKSYVDNISAGLNFHAAVHAATTADLSATYDNGAKTLSASGAFPQVDGHTINETERVLVKSQSNAVQNGIYTLTDDGDPSGTWVLTRASDADNTPGGEVAYGDFTFVQNGTLNGGQGFIMTTTGTITLGTSNIVYTQFNTGQSVVAGNGLSEATPGTLSINTAITADLSTAQTLTNKTLTTPTLTTPFISSGINLGISGGGVGTNGQVIQSDGTDSRWASLITTSSTTAITSNSAVTIDTVALVDFVSIEYQLTIKQGTSIRSSKVLVQTDGTSVDYSEYGIVSTGTAITGVAVAASVSSTNMILQVTVSNATTTAARAFVVKNTIIGTAPSAPTIGSATIADTQSVVSFTAPQDNGGSAITSYTVTSTPESITASGSSSPITVTGLTNGTAYTFTVTATNKYGTSSASSASNSVTPTVIPVVTGGTLSSDATYYYRTFTSTSSLQVASGSVVADILTIAGGGSGGRGSNGAGGGGAGGLVYSASQTLSPNTYACAIGAGGGSATNTNPVSGSNSQFASLTAAVGGGRGGDAGTAPAVGGSGGGGGRSSSFRTGALGTSGQGFRGGTVHSSLPTGAGGGGAGGEALQEFGQVWRGGVGSSSYSSWLSAIAPQMTGVSGWTTTTSTGNIASGGSGTRPKVDGAATAPAGGGGAGGWQDGSNASEISGSAAISNTGGGGGGGSNMFGGSILGPGGSGIIIVRYTRSQVGG